MTKDRKGGDGRVEGESSREQKARGIVEQVEQVEQEGAVERRGWISGRQRLVSLRIGQCLLVIVFLLWCYLSGGRCRYERT